MLTSHVTSNLDQWVEDGYITADQRESIAQLLENAVQDAYDNGLAQSDNDGGYDLGYDDGYAEGLASLESKRDEWFEQGWAEALLEHGIEE